MKALLTNILSVGILLLFSIPQSIFAACVSVGDIVNAGSSTAWTYTTSATCSIAADAIEGIDGAAGEDSTNKAIWKISGTGVSATLNSGSAGTTTFYTNSFTLASGGSLVIGSTKAKIVLNQPLWVADADADGWSSVALTNSSLSLLTATASAKRRVGLMRGRAVDVNDAVYDTSNYSYGYGQSTYYSYGQSTYYSYGQSTYYSYSYGQSTYYSYSYGESAYQGSYYRARCF